MYLLSPLLVLVFFPLPDSFTPGPNSLCTFSFVLALSQLFFHIPRTVGGRWTKRRHQTHLMTARGERRERRELAGQRSNTVPGW